MVPPARSGVPPRPRPVGGERQAVAPQRAVEGDLRLPLRRMQLMERRSAPRRRTLGPHAHELAQHLPAARQARAYGADGNVEHRGDLLVPHAFQSDQEENRALLLRQLGDGAFEIAELEPLALVRRRSQRRLAVGEADSRTFAYRAAHMIDVLVVEDGEKPSAEIRPALPEMNFAERPGQAVLH